MVRVLRKIIFCLLLLCPLYSFADIDGNPPTKFYQENKLRGSYAAIGSTLTLADQYEYGMYNFYLLSESSASFVQEFPSDAKIKKAFLFWSGSTYDYPAIADNTAKIKTPYGQTYDVSTNQCILLPISLGNFYYCRADISDKLKGLPIKKGDSYTVGSIDAYISNNCNIDPHCQARYAGWAMIVIWESQTFNRYRDIVIYDGFYHLDETTTSAGIAPPFTLDGFVVGDPPYAELTFFGLEGDPQLGEPEQSLLPKTDPLYCVTCNDFIRIKRPGGSYIYLQNDGNPPNNIWNSSHSAVEANGVGIDIDTFNIGAGGLNVFMPGDTSLIVQPGVGDGFPVHPISGNPNAPDFNDSAAGGGESVFLGFVALGLDTIAPIFENSQKHVDKLEASAGEILTYTIDVINTGSADATNVIVTDLLPSNTTYVPSSTYLDGTLIPDVAGGSPLFTGMNIGTVKAGVAFRKRIQFKVKINEDVLGGTYIYNEAVIKCNEVSPFTTNRVATLIKVASLSEFSKKVLSITDPYGRQKSYLEPGDSINYEIRIKNSSSFPITIERFEDPIPKHTRIVSVTPPPGSTNESTQNTIIIKNISLEAYGAGYIRFTLRVDTVQEWGNTDPINGYQIKNQATLTGGSLDRVYLSDDPTTPAPQDPTILTVRYGSDLSSSSKSVVDLNGGNPEPGDELLYTINVRNTGTRTVGIQVEDQLSPYAEFISIDSLVPAQMKYTVLGNRLTFYNFSLGTNETATIKYRVRISYSIPAGTIEFKNTARIYSLDEPNYFIDVSASLTVVSGPSITLFQKGAKINGVEQRSAKPGDRIDYYITIKNTGNGSANNVIIEDPIDSNLTIDSSSISDGGRFTNGKILWEYLTIGVNESRTLRFSSTVNIPIENNTFIRNQANLSSQDIKKIFTDDPTTPILGDSTDIIVRFNPQVKNISKYVNDQKSIWAHGGDVVTFKIEFENDSPGPLKNVVISDTVSKLLKNIILLTPGGIVDANQTINWNLPVLGYNEKKVFEFQAEVKPPVKPSTIITNYATVLVGSAYSKNTDTVTIYVYDEPNLSNTFKYASYDGDYSHRTHNVAAGDLLIFSIIVKNSGPVSATNVEVRDPIDSRIVEVSDISDSGSKIGNEVVWHISSLGSNETKVLSFKGRIKSPLENGTKIYNQAVIKSSETKETLSDDPDTPQSPDPLELTVSSSPFLTLSLKAKNKSGEEISGVVRPLDEIDFVIEILNTGNSIANGVVITDYLDTDRLEVLSINDGGVISGSQIVWNIPAIDIGEQNKKVISFRARVKECVGGKIVNYAEGISKELKSYVKSNTLEIQIDSLAKKGRFYKRLISPREIKPLEKVIYELSYDTEDISLCDALITDVFPDALELISSTDGKISGNTLTIAVKKLKQLTPVRVEARLKSPQKNGSIVKNQAYIEASNYNGRLLSDDPDTTTIDDPTEFKVSSSPDIYLIKTADRNEVPSGGVINYTILLLNNGNDIAYDIRVTDGFEDMYQYIEEVTPKGEGVYDSATHTLSFTAPQLGLAPQYYKRFEFSVRIKGEISDGTLLLNQSSVSGSNFALVLSDNNLDKSDGINKTSVRVVNRPDLSITKTPYRSNGEMIKVDDGVYPGDEYQYRIVIRNDSDIEARDLVLIDDTDESLISVGEISSGGSYDGNEIKFDYNSSPQLKSLKKGDRIELWYKVKVRSDAPKDSQIVNQARLRCSNVTTEFLSDDERTSKKDDPTIVKIKNYSGPYFGMSKKEYVVNSQPVKSGDEVNFIITILNTGDVASTETKLYDEISKYGWEYKKGSTKLNGALVADIDGRSPLESGLYISSVKYGVPSTQKGVVNPVSDGGLQENMAVVEFVAKVPPDVTLMKNSARLTYKGGEYQIPEVQIPIGDRPFIRTLLKEYSISSDKNGNSIADIGDNIRFYLRFKNEGSKKADRVEITDILPTQVSYLAGTMKLTINSIEKSLTDEIDSDEGELITINGQVVNRFVINNLPPGAEVLITFDAVVNVCGGFLNQAELIYDGQRVLSDFDGDSSNGIQKTFVATCELPQNYFELYKSARDENGSKVEPDDKIVFRISITSQGNSREEEVTFMDDLPKFVKFSGLRSDIIMPETAQFNYVPPPAGRNNNGLLIIKGLKFGSNTSQNADIIFNVKVDKSAKYGDIIENKAILYTKDNRAFESNTVRLTVGGEVGTASVQGILFRKMDRDEKNYKYGTDILLSGYSIVAEKIDIQNNLVPPPLSAPSGRVYTDENGKFVILNLKNDMYRLFAYNEKGYLVGIKDVDLVNGSLTNVEFPIVPTGVVYSSESYLPVENLKVVALGDDESRMEYVTDRNGIYWFDFEKKRYRIEVISPDGSYVFPSVKIPPDNKVVIDEAGYVSDDFMPQTLKEKRYLTEVDFGQSATDRPRLVNNNLPVDSTSSLIVFYKTASKSIASMGDLIEYSLYIQNRTSKSLSFYITDEPDNGLVIKSKEFSIGRLENNSMVSTGRLEVKIERVNSKLIIKSLPFDVPSGDMRVIRYYAYVSPEKNTIKLSNRATLFETSGRVIKTAYNTIYRRRDYDFENSMIFGRVFCDSNGNGRYDFNEQGIGSARVMLDTGYIAITDVSGLYHFPELNSGYHIVKIDVDSLPAGIRPQYESVDMYFTDGLPAKIDLPLDCSFRKIIVKDTDFYTSENRSTLNNESGVDSKKVSASFSTDFKDVKGEKLQSKIDKVDTEKKVSTESSSLKSGNKIEDETMESVIYLPEEKVTKSDRILITGEIASGKKVFFKGKEIKINGGKLWYEIPLEYGKNKIVLDIVDDKNRSSSVFFEIERQERDPFVLAYCNLWLSNSDFYPDGFLPSTHITASSLGFDGKVVLYARHHLRNKLIFKDIDIIVHFDSSKMRERELNLLENRLADYLYFPTFGDSSSVIKDVNSIDKLYIRVDADKNRLVFGNTNTQISGIEQFRYDKQIYGLYLSLDNTFERYHTTNRTKVFAGIPVEYSRHRRTILKATGGSVYFLGTSDIINGSESVRVVVMDNLTGDKISERILARYTDYAINYSTGTIILNQPLNSYIETPSSIGLNANPAGNVYLIVEYDYFTLDSNENLSLGIDVKEEFGDMLQLNGGIINEFESGESRYRLYSAGLTLKYLRYSSFKGEFTASQSGYSDYLFSSDGGISGRALAVESKDGYAILLEDKGDLADLLLKDEKLLSYRLFFRMNTPYFASANSLINQGIKSVGAELSKEISGRFSSSINFYMHLIEPLDLNTMERNGDISLYNTQQKIKYRINDRLDLLAENLYTYSDFDTSLLKKSFSTDVLGSGLSYNLTPKVNIFGSIHTVFWGDSKEFDGLEDRLYLTLGSTYKVKPKLYLTLSDTLRFNLDNYTQLSARTPISDTGSVYFGERVGSYNSQLIVTSILGAEEQLISGVSSYGEYQIDTFSTDLNSRAVLGTKGRFSISDGINVMINYEHTEVVSNGELSYNYSDPAYIADPALQAIQSYNIEPQNKGPLYGYSYVQRLNINNSLIYDYMGLNYPLGFQVGDNSRDVISGAIEYLRLKNLKSSLFGEFRFDNNDESRGGEDRMQYLLRISLLWGITKDLSLSLSTHYLAVNNLEHKRDEYRVSENSFGLALRPRDFDWINLFLKYSSVYEDRYDLQLNSGNKSYSHIISLIPVFELPYGFEIVEKLALKRSYLAGESLLGSDSVDTLLWINRLNYNFYRRSLSIGLEYRILALFGNETKSGFLIDAGYNFNRYFKLAIGYNFTDFSDNLYRLRDYNSHGLFIRATGKY